MIGIIGGSGLEKPGLLQNPELVNLATPYGKTAAPLLTGKLNGIPIAIASRHGFEHEFIPTFVPYKANLWALKKLGVTAILAASACGSLREEIRPGDFVIPNQLIDFTKQRSNTSLQDHSLNAHTPFGEPFCPALNQLLSQSCQELGFTNHTNKTVITIEGPRFSTRAESQLFRQWNCDIINMTTSTEAALAREMNLCYGVLAMATDYDAWKTNQAPVTIEEVLAVMRQNADRALHVFSHTISKINEQTCPKHHNTPSTIA